MFFLYDEVCSSVDYFCFLCKTSFIYQRPPLQSFKCNDKWNTLNFKYVNFKGDLKRAEVDRITVFFCYVKSIFCVILI